MSKNVLLGSFSCWPDLGDPNVRYEKFLKTGAGHFKSLIESLLIFDRVVIPTNDYMPLALITGVFGDKAASLMLESEVIQFARFAGMICYVGNGGGIRTAKVQSGDERKYRWSSAPSEEAARTALEGLNTSFDRASLRQKAVKETIEFSVENNNELFSKTVYDEVSRIPHILSATGVIDLNRLPGIEPTGVRLLGSFSDIDKPDDISQVLRTAQACVETRAATIAACDDIFTSSQVGELFRYGMNRFSKDHGIAAGYSKVVELTELPDIGELVLKDKGVLVDIIKIRNSKSGEEFRKWFHENCRDNPQATTREYIALLKTVPAVQSLPAKLLRFIVQVGVSAGSLLLSPVAGLAAGAGAGAIDSFVVERTVKGASPKIFLEKLEALTRDRDLEKT